MGITNVNPDPGLISLSVKVNGTEIPAEYQVVDLRVEKAINQISAAYVTLLDEGDTGIDFAISSEANFAPGKEIEIEAGYDNNAQSIFKGIITGQRLKLDGVSGKSLILECRDLAVKMNVSRKSKVFVNISDNKLISKIISQYSGLNFDIDNTQNHHTEMVQYDCSDWDFVLSMAQTNGLVVSTQNNKVRVFDPFAATKSAVGIIYGDNLLDFDATLDATTQFEQVDAKAWDFQHQQLRSKQARNNDSGPGNLSGNTLSEVTGESPFQLFSTATVSENELAGWAESYMTRTELAKIVGEARIQGTSSVNPGESISLSGMGERFDGNHFVSKVIHVVSDGSWTTELGLGLALESVTQTAQHTRPQASGLVPGVSGLYNAKVTKIKDDPESQFRIQIEIPLFSESEPIWARHSQFYASKGQGAYFSPEVDDEVIVGFLNGDPRFPIILGSVYSQSISPDCALHPDQKANQKGIVTKSGLKVLFDDENKITSILTPDDNRFILDDKNQQISITDKHHNNVLLSKNGINFSSAKNISIHSDQVVNIQGKEGVSIQGEEGVNIQSDSADVSVKGMNITAKAEVEYSAEAKASASVQGAGELTLKGAMVFIN